MRRIDVNVNKPDAIFKWRPISRPVLHNMVGAWAPSHICELCKIAKRDGSNAEPLAAQYQYNNEEGCDVLCCARHFFKAWRYRQKHGMPTRRVA